MKYLIPLFGLILIYLPLGRVGAIPYGIAFYKWYVLTLIILCLDIFQVTLYFYIYEKSYRWKPFVNIRWKILRRRVTRLRETIGHQKIFKGERKIHSRFLVRAQKWGQWGVFAIAAVPFIGGGLWSGAILAKLLKLKQFRSYIIFVTGSLISCLFLTLGFHGIKLLILQLLNL